jgi:hypothetical protein
MAEPLIINASTAPTGMSMESPPVLGSCWPSGIVSRITLSLGEVLSPVVADPAVPAPVVSAVLAPVVSPLVVLVVVPVVSVVPVLVPVVLVPVVVPVLVAVVVLVVLVVAVIEPVVVPAIVPVVPVVVSVVPAVVAVVHVMVPPPASGCQSGPSTLKSGRSAMVVRPLPSGLPTAIWSPLKSVIFLQSGDQAGLEEPGNTLLCSVPSAFIT